MTLKRLFVLTPSHRQGTVRFAHFYTRRPAFLKSFHSYVQFIGSLHNFYEVIDAKESLHRAEDHYKHGFEGRGSLVTQIPAFLIIMSISICSYL